MLAGEIRNQIDSIWNTFWTGGIPNPLEVIGQITYLLFIKRLNDLHTLQERKSITLKRPMERRLFAEGKDDSVFLGQRLMLYRANRERMTPEYLLASFRGAFLQHRFNRHGSSSAVEHLPLPACRIFQVNVDPIPLQREFARRVTAVEALKMAHRASLAELDALFATLQQSTFCGEL